MGGCVSHTDGNTSSGGQFGSGNASTGKTLHLLKGNWKYTYKNLKQDGF